MTNKELIRKADDELLLDLMDECLEDYTFHLFSGNTFTIENWLTSEAENRFINRLEEQK